jgi:hypothetical protein
MTVGDWLAEAVVAHARADKRSISADAEWVSADGGSNVPTIPLSKELETVLNDIQNRVGKMEAERRKSFLERIFGRHN